MVRDFAGVLQREKADMGLFICLHKPTREMLREAASAGMAKTVHGDIPKLQIVAIEDWFNRILPKLPPLEHLPSAALSSIKRRPPTAGKRPDPAQQEFLFAFPGDKGSKGSKDQVIHFNPRMFG
jgi:site-specific DNA-methyltransferase (adenine-specific)